MEKAHYVEFAAAAIADAVQRAVGEELLPAIPRIKELEEEHELTLASHRSLAFLFGIKSTSGSVQRPALGRPGVDDCGITFWVGFDGDDFTHYAPTL